MRDLGRTGANDQVTEILVYKAYPNGVEGLDLGGSAPESVILMLLDIVLTVSSSPMSNAAHLSPVTKSSG
jgi:hypothetical protein